jgi:hypothetical protein
MIYCVITGSDTNVFQGPFGEKVGYVYRGGYATFDRDEMDAEQHRRERAFVAQFSGGPAPIVPQFVRKQILQRPEFHARSNPRSG